MHRKTAVAMIVILVFGVSSLIAAISSQAIQGSLYIPAITELLTKHAQLQIVDYHFEYNPSTMQWERAVLNITNTSSTEQLLGTIKIDIYGTTSTAIAYLSPMVFGSLMPSQTLQYSFTLTWLTGYTVFNTTKTIIEITQE